MANFDDNTRAAASARYLTHLRQLAELENAIRLAGDDGDGSVLASVADGARSEIIDGIGVISNLSGIPERVIVERYINCKPERQIAEELYFCERSIRSFVRSGKIKLYDYLPDCYREEVVA